MKKKTMTAVLLVVVLVLGMIPISSSVAEKQIELTYWTHSNVAFVGVAEKMCEAYMQANPNVKINYEYFSDLDTKLMSSLAAGTAADVVEKYGSPIRFAKGGLIQPVSEAVMTKEQIESTFYPAAIENRLYNDQYYGLPEEFNVESPGLLVNVALLRDLGIEIPASWDENMGPASWDEIIDLAKQLTVNDGGFLSRSGLGIIGGEEVSMFLSLIWQMGGDYRDPDNMTVHFETEEAKAACEFVMNLITGEDAVHGWTASGRYNGFVEGTVVMTIGAPWYTAVIDQDVPGFEYSYYNLPAFIEGSDPYFLGEGGWGHIVSSSSKNPDAAWEFVKFLLEDENLLEWAKETGCVPSRPDLAQDPYFTEGDGRKAIYPVLQIAQYGRDPGAYTMDSYTMVWDICARNFQAITSEQVSIEDGLKAMQTEVEAMIANLQNGDIIDTAS